MTAEDAENISRDRGEKRGTLATDDFARAALLCYKPHRPTSSPPNPLPLNAPNPLQLVSACDDQDQTFSAAFQVLREAIEERVFPCASVAITRAGRLAASRALGHFVYDESVELLGERGWNLLAARETLFDLASVTKAVATTTMAAMLYERGLLEVDTPVCSTVPEILGDDPKRKLITFRMLLAHSSGLPAYEKLYLRAQTREELLSAAFSTPLTAEPGTRAEYSDIGFIILGTALERIAGEAIDRFCQREIFEPLAMKNTTFNPPEEMRAMIPPTSYDRTLRNRVIQGEVQDENAFVLGGVAGHAGLFSTAEDLARFAHAMLMGGSPVLRAETVEVFTRRESSPAGTSRALGWDTPSSPSQSGRRFSSMAYGHLGYSGTSLWIDPERAISITMLTNRTWPDCSHQGIKQVRPRFHDAVMEALTK